MAARPSRPRRPAEPDVDPVDEALIGLLQEDGRRTYGELAKAVGLSEPATRQRVNRLRSDGTLRIVAVVDPIRLGLRVVAMVGIRVVGDSRAAARQLAEVDSIEYVVLAAGAYDILVEIVCESELRLLEIINESIRSIESISSTETFVYLDIAKQEFSWGSRGARPGVQDAG